jgi:hypothetical protein
MVAAMKTSHTSLTVHPAGEASRLSVASLPVETYGGRIYVEWNPQEAVTPLGPAQICSPRFHVAAVPHEFLDI